MKIVNKIALGAVLALGMSLNAYALNITPASGCDTFDAVTCDPVTRWSGNQTDQPGIDAAIAPIIGTSVELYKSNAGGVDEKALADNYKTTFSPTIDPTAATIEWLGGAFVGPTAYLLVKDGAAQPGWYLFNLTALGWDGKATLNLSGFWAGVSGSISHVSLYGSRGTEVPEPATLALLGMGLVGFGLARRRRKI
jgi:hypothetical protein